MSATATATATTTKTLLEAKSIEAGYGASQVLFGIDLRIGAGEVLALLGRNGMGKSTLLKVLTGTLSPMRGDVHFGGDAIGGPNKSMRPDAIARRGVAIVPEGRHVFPNLSVDEHLRAPVRAAHRAGRSRRSTASFRAWRSARPTRATSSRAASSRCWRSRARFRRTRAS
jgi:ABC-type branched-subunit amino acid transport system ATPase component